MGVIGTDKMFVLPVSVAERLLVLHVGAARFVVASTTKPAG